MFVRMFQVATAAVLGAALTVSTGCCSSAKCQPAPVVRAPCATPVARVSCDTPIAMTADLPSNPVPGECYAKVFIPPKMRTVSERVCVKEASERVEIVPAQYGWAEERVLVKEASTRLEETPAEYASRDLTIETEACHTDWHMQKGAPCTTNDKQPVGDVFCLVKTPPQYKKVGVQYTAKPACVREVQIPAEYTTVRREVVKSPASTRRISIPAEYTSVDKTSVCEGGRMEWQKVLCETNASAYKINQVKEGLMAAGYMPGPMDGKLGQQDWSALKDYQTTNRLGVGGLTYVTLKRLGVSVQ